jgi:quinol monooxygenase YgiN
MIIVLGHIEIDPSEVDEFLGDVAAIDPTQRAGSGCISYSTVGDSRKTGHIAVAERWQDQHSLTAHLEHEGTRAFIEKWSGRMRAEVMKYDAFNERSLVE